MSNESVLSGILDVTRAALPVAGGLYTGDLRGVQAGQAVANLIPTKDQRMASRLQELRLEEAEYRAGRRGTLEEREEKLFTQQVKRNEQIIDKGEDEAFARDSAAFLNGAANFTQREIVSSLQELDLPYDNKDVEGIMATGAGQGFKFLSAARMALQQDRPDLARDFATRAGAVFFTGEGGKEMMRIGGHEFNLDTLDDVDAFGVLAEEYGRGIAQEFRGNAFRASVQNGDISALASAPVFDMAVQMGASKGQAEAITRKVFHDLPPAEKNLLLASSAADQLFKGVRDEGILEQANAVAGQLGVMGVSFDGYDGNGDSSLDPSEIQVVINPGTAAHELLFESNEDSVATSPQRISLDEFRSLVKSKVDLVSRARAQMPKPKLKTGSVVENVERTSPGAIEAFLNDHPGVSTSDKYFESRFMSWLQTSKGVAWLKSQRSAAAGSGGDGAKPSRAGSASQQGLFNAGYYFPKEKAAGTSTSNRPVGRGKTNPQSTKQSNRKVPDRTRTHRATGASNRPR